MSFIDKIRESYYNRKVTKEAKSITKQLIKQPDEITRFVPIPEHLIEKDDRNGMSIFEKCKQACEDYANGNIVVYPDINLTDKQNGPKCIGIKIKFRF
jgi:hypothetical protein